MAYEYINHRLSPMIDHNRLQVYQRHEHNFSFRVPKFQDNFSLYNSELSIKIEKTSMQKINNQSRIIAYLHDVL